jgi:tetratricopeptide (TPR) repeat protein
MLNLLNILKKSAKKIIFGAFSLLIILFMVKQSFAQGTVATTDIINQIEKVLTSPEGSIILNRKSTINIDKTPAEPGAEDGEKRIDIQVTEKRDDKANRVKEKLAYNATMSGQYEVSLELYKQILRAEKTNNYAKFGLATSYHKLKQYKQAKAAYYDLLYAEIDNKDEVVGNLLEILVEESPKDAKYVLVRLSSQSPNTHYILARSALTYNKLGKPDEAILLLKRAIAINPQNMQYKLNLAIILDQNDESGVALQYYRQVLRHYISSGSQDQETDLSSIRQRINFIENNS